MRQRNVKGLTLVEVVVVMGLASIALIGVISLGTMASRSGLYAQRTERSQMSLEHALHYVTEELRQATYVAKPAGGASGGALEGCANAAVIPPSAGPLPLDAGQPMRWFAFCSADGAVYYHRGFGCPAAYSCGVGSSLEFVGGGGSAASAAFSRPSSLSTEVDVSLSAGTGEHASTVQSAVAYAAAAGTGQ